MSSPRYLTPQQLLPLLRTAPVRTVVIDVRESDRRGGHLRGSHHIPAPSLRADPAAYLHVARDADRVVFHCMYSQVRGPACASAFARALESASGEAKPEVCVLAGGFAGVAQLARPGGPAADLVEEFDRVLYAPMD